MPEQPRNQMGQIYEFPRKVVEAAERRRAAAAVSERASRPTAGVECGSGWYHAAAVENARAPRKT